MPTKPADAFDQPPTPQELAALRNARQELLADPAARAAIELADVQMTGTRSPDFYAGFVTGLQIGGANMSAAGVPALFPHVFLTQGSVLAAAVKAYDAALAGAN